MMKIRLSQLAFPAIVYCLSLLLHGAAASSAADLVEIPFEKFVLDNGLTLIVHQDHKSPIVAVNVWYHVGSKNEKQGKTGFAHLFEHLMFNGSENHDDDYFKPFDRVGVTGQNGTTDADRTNYFQTVPAPALDMALWMESDRMGHLLGAITQARLDEQRDVVKNEKRQRENQPYGKVLDLVVENAYPPGHPYSWSTIGSMEDLSAASVEDVHEWFAGYYGAANAVVVVAGDVDPETVRAKVEKYFGDIPAGPPVERQKRWIAKRSGVRRQVVQERVPQARIIKAWNVPEDGSDDGAFLQLASSVLASGKTARLYQRLVYEERMASNVVSFAWLRELGGLFIVWATALPGQDLAEIEAILDEEIARFLDKGPTGEELAGAKMQVHSGFVRGVERIGGFGGKSDILASSEVYGGSPDAYVRELSTLQNATRKRVRNAARRWLSDGAYILEVHPFPEFTTAPEGADRSAVPDGGVPPAVHFPSFSRSTLSSGLEVIVAERHDIPVVDFSLMVNAGFASDQFAAPGTASLAMNMLDEGTGSRDALEISRELTLLGAHLSSGSDLDTSFVILSALRENLEPSLQIFAEVILEPAFSETDLERLRAQQIASIQREKAAPRSLALRVFPGLVYGSEHAYGIPFTGSGTEASVSQIDTSDVQSFHATWFKPNNATLVVVGDTTLEEITPRLESLFRAWKPGEVPQKNLTTVENRKQSSVYLLDRPGASQTILIAGHLAPPKANPDEAAIETMNAVLGSGFTSRINMNLREDKNWAYGAYSFLVDAQGQRPFIAHAAVQTDKTAPAMLELRRELQDIVGPRPPDADELARAKDRQTLTLPGRWETANSVGGSISAIVRFGYPDDYWDTYAERLTDLSLAEVGDAAQSVIHPDQLIWVVVGDREAIEAEIRALDFGELHLLDADGRPIEDGPERSPEPGAS
jgi:zinc protease